MNGRRFHLGVASYRNPVKLARTLESIKQMSVTDWHCFIVHNPSDDAEGIAALQTAKDAEAADRRFVLVEMSENRGYAGAVNEIVSCAGTEYIGYLDNDVIIHSPGWDEILCSYLDRFHELGIIFPNSGAYPIQRPAYQEILWGVGFAWVINILGYQDVTKQPLGSRTFMDTSLGHQEEADLAIRLRLAGWKIGAAPEVRIAHDATASNNPASLERINRGVVAWMNRWCSYFGGKNLNYHSPNVLRMPDWNVNALHMEEYFRQALPGLNDNPETVTIRGEKFDLIKVPRPHGFYRGRVI